MTHILEVDECIAHTCEISLEQANDGRERSVSLAVVREVCRYPLSTLAPTRSAAADLPIRRYMKSYFPRLVSSTISLSMA